MFFSPVTVTTKNNRQIELRSPQTNEADLILKTMTEMARHSPYILSTPESFLKRTIESQIKWIQDGMDNPASVIIAAFWESKLVGLCNAQSYSDVKRRHRAALGLSLLPHLRGEGLGHAMMLVLLEEIKKFPYIQVIELDVMKNNTAAVRLYERLGFQVTGIYPRAYCLPGGEVSDNINMILTLE